MDQGKIVQDSQKDLAMYNKTTYILILKSLFCYNHKFISVQSLNQLQFFATPWTAAGQASPSFTISQSLLKLMSIESMVLTHYLILCHSLLPLPSIFLSTRVFSNESALRIRWPKYWSFCISASNQYPGLISFKIDWFELLAVQGILKSLLQYHSLKASIICWKTQNKSTGNFLRHPSPKFPQC